MIDLDAADLAEDATYRLLNGVVTPRAIAWVSTLNETGGVNLAPFSCFMYISPKPPLIAISIGGRHGIKDTIANARRVGEFTINSVHEALARPMVDSSRRYQSGISEAEDLGIELAAGYKVSVPRVAGALVSMECVVHQVVKVDDTHNHSLLIGRVVCFRVAEEVWGGDGLDMEKFRAFGRLGGRLYMRPGEIERIDPTPDERFKA